MLRSLPKVLVVGLAVGAASATLVFLAFAFFRSPPNPVAAELGFEALRVARGFPLYVDPFRGAWEDGAPPARYYVLYTPMFPWLVGKLAPPTFAGVQLVGRLITLFAWLVVMLAPVAMAPRPRRSTTLVAAMLAGSVYFLVRHAVSMTPDTLAAALVVVAVGRAARRGRFDEVSALLLLAAPFFKPSCLGGVAGAVLVQVVRRPTGFWRTSFAGALTALAFAALSHYASDGAWLSNIVRSTGQPVTWARWTQEMGSRFPLLGLPHLILVALGLRRRLPWTVLGPLAGSLAWTTFMMAKHGSGGHYWLEPTGLALVAVSAMPARTSASAWSRRFEAWGPSAFAGMVLATSVPAYLREPARWTRHREQERLVDAYCVRSPGEFVIAGDLVLEVALNRGRISVPAWQSGFLARSGKFPSDAWREDLVRPEVRWLALGSDPRDPVGGSNDEIVERSPFGDVLKDVVLANYAFDRVVAGVWIFRRNP